MDNHQARNVIYRAKSLLDISAFNIYKRIFFLDNVPKLRGEIPLTLELYIGRNYCRFYKQFEKYLQAFVSKFPPPLLLELDPYKVYTLFLSCTIYLEFIGNISCIHRFCTFCFYRYVNFKVPIKARTHIITIHESPYTFRGITFLENMSHYVCHICHLVLLKLDCIDDDLITTSNLSINNFDLY